MRRHIFTPLALVFFLTICGAYVRLSGLSNFAFSPDELIHIYISQNDLPHLFLANSQSTNAPLPYLILNLLFFYHFPVDQSRLISLIPGILLIPVSYLLGKKFFNPSSGLYLSTFVTFGYCTVVLSQVVRQYSLFILFSALTLICASYLQKTFSLKWLFYYLLFASLATLAQHSNILFLGWIFVANLPYLPKSKRLLWAAIHMVPLIFFALSWFYQGAYTWHQSSHYYQALTGWLASGFSSRPKEIWDQVYGIFNYYSIPLFVFKIIFGSATILGFYSLLKRRIYFPLIIFVGLWISNLILSILKIYPFSASRHTIHLLIPTLLLTASALLEFNSFIKSHQTKIFSLFFTAILIIAFVIPQKNYLSLSEHPLTNFQLTNFKQDLKTSLSPNTVIITDRQTGFYLGFPQFPNTYQFITSPIVHTTYAGYPVIFSNTWPPNATANELTHLLKNSGTPKKIIIAQAGWDQDKLTQLFKNTLLTSRNFFDLNDNSGYQIFVVEDPPKLIEYLSQ